ncbi:PHP domain-containing protein [Leptolyngbya sp. AN02str]|uniref:PHP domain-containing protein n=1 Tax=Leptolyngbya sp. AN02str TaxID=3423363 RepID=UPI003D31A438
MAGSLVHSMASTPAQDVLALRRVFEAIAPDSCPHRYNFHMHTTCSDGRMHPEQLAEQAVGIGLSGLAITDHHSTQGFRRAQLWLSEYRHKHRAQTVPHLWVGIEINANLLGEEVHILGYAFDPDHAAMQPYTQRQTTTGEHYQAQTVIASIHTAGGVAILAHPARYRQSPALLIPAAAECGINGVETYYAYNNPSPWMPSPRQTQEVWQLGEAHGLLHTCGTDTHGLSLLQRL